MTLRASIYKFIFNCRRRFIISRPRRNQNTRKDNSPQSPSKFGQYLSSAVAQQQHLKKKITINHSYYRPLHWSISGSIPLLWGKQSLNTLFNIVERPATTTNSKQQEYFQKDACSHLLQDTAPTAASWNSDTVSWQRPRPVPQNS